MTDDTRAIPTDEEAAEGAVGPGEEPPEGDDGPVDGDQHAPSGENPQDVGEETDEPDTPLPDEDSAVEQDRLHRAMAIAIEMGLVISSTTQGGHSPNSYHYSKPYRWVVIAGRRYQVGRAADVAKYGNPQELYRRYFLRVGEPMYPTELFFDPMGYSWKNGRRVNWTVGGHRDHVHVAF